MNINASELGKLSAKKRLQGLTSEQIKEYMKQVRNRQTPTIKTHVAK